MNADHIIFDLDGTLIHTPKEYICSTMRSVLDRMGLGIISDEDCLRSWFSPDIDSHIASFVEDASLFWSLLREKDCIQSRMREARPYPDVAALGPLNALGISFSLLTSAQKEMAKTALILIH